MTERDLGLLGLGMRARTVVVGTAPVRLGLQRDELHLVVLAADHSHRTEEKVARLARGRGVRIVEGPVSEELGRRLGSGPVQAVGVRDRHLAAAIGVADASECETDTWRQPSAWPTQQ